MARFDEQQLTATIAAAASWLLREFATPLRPTQREQVRAALQAGYLYGDHDAGDPDLLAVGAAYTDASERLGRVPVIVRRLGPAAYGVMVGLDLPLPPSLAAAVRELGGTVSEEGVAFLVRSREEAEALLPACQRLYEQQPGQGKRSSPH
jgi:hypothetical protein